MHAEKATAICPSPIGPLTVTTTSIGLWTLSFGQRPESDRHTATGDAASILSMVSDQLAEYFAGERQSFSVPIDWSLSNGWALAIRQHLYKVVSYGQTVGYGELAAGAGRPDGARAVGGIMAGNPIPVVVPCHRVIAADGSLGGFAGSGGAMVETKRRLLEMEGSAAPTLF